MTDATNKDKENFRETYTVTGEIYWAKVQSPDEEGTYRVEISVTDESRELAKELGLTVFTDKRDASRQYLKFKRNSIKQDGTPVKPLRVVDGNLNPLKALIANGSFGTVEFFPYDWKNPKTKQTGTSAYLVALKVSKLIEYTPPKRAGKLEADDAPIATEQNKFSVSGE